MIWKQNLFRPQIEQSLCRAQVWSRQNYCPLYKRCWMISMRMVPRVGQTWNQQACEWSQGVRVWVYTSDYRIYQWKSPISSPGLDSFLNHKVLRSRRRLTVNLGLVLVCIKMWRERGQRTRVYARHSGHKWHAESACVNGS